MNQAYKTPLSSSITPYQRLGGPRSSSYFFIILMISPWQYFTCTLDSCTQAFSFFIYFSSEAMVPSWCYFWVLSCMKDLWFLFRMQLNFTISSFLNSYFIDQYSQHNFFSFYIYLWALQAFSIAPNAWLYIYRYPLIFPYLYFNFKPKSRICYSCW